MKPLQALLTLFALAFLPLHAASLDDLTYTTGNEGASIRDCNASATGELVIPDTIEGYPVTSIGSNAFRECRSLTSITIPDSVTSIGVRAFSSCTALTSITIPDGVTSIGESAFDRCENLTSITIPDSVTSIGYNAFYNCRSLTSITIPDSVTSIGARAFCSCTALTSITIPDGVTSIGDRAFRDCNSLTSITIPDAVNSIGDNAFFACGSLTSVTIPDGVTSIGNGVFGYCRSLTSITIPDGVTSIGNSALKSCSNLTSITIPDSVTSIADSAFSECTSLTSVNFQGLAPTIGERAFEGLPEGAKAYVSNEAADSFGGLGSTFNRLTVALQISQFQVIEGNFTWQEAKADAEAKGGHLATVTSSQEMSQLSQFLRNYEDESGIRPSPWIGGFEAGSPLDWRWVTGEPFSYENWYVGLTTVNPPGDDEIYLTYGSGGWEFKPINRNAIRLPNYILEIIPQNPAPPLVQLGALYESPSGEAIVINATPAAGFPAEFTYQWCFDGFKIPEAFGGTVSSVNIESLEQNEGTWSVTVTNEIGSVEQSFEYRVYVDSDLDGLSDAFEELISETNINNPDTDNDGLVDGDEVNTYRTNPNSSDSDSDGFTDLYELETAYDPNSAESVPDALVNIMTAIEVKFNAALGATYAIEFSTDSQNWSVIEDDIVGEGGAVERLYSKTDFPTGFFRVERRDQ
jgi:hypothetical protein